MKRLAVCGPHALQVARNYIVGLTGGNSLGEFTGVVGIDLPLGLLVRHAANIHFYTIDGTIIRSPDGPENEGVGIFWFELLGRGSRNGQRCCAGAESGQKENKQQAEQQAE